MNILKLSGLDEDAARAELKKIFCGLHSDVLKELGFDISPA